MNKYLRITLKTISALIVIIAVTLAIFMAGLKFFGFQIYTIVSGSMEPTYHVGSLIYVKEVDTTTLKEKDTITFELSDNTIATHRIVEIVYDEDNHDKYKFRTKGDANENVDANLVESNKVLGKAIFTIPYLGYLAAYIQTPPGNIVAICLSISAIILVIIIDLITDEKKDNNKKTTNKK